VAVLSSAGFAVTRLLELRVPIHPGANMFAYGESRVLHKSRDFCDSHPIVQRCTVKCVCVCVCV